MISISSGAIMKSLQRASILIFFLVFTSDLMAESKNVAVIVYPQSAMAKQYSRIALARQLIASGLYFYKLTTNNR